MWSPTSQVQKPVLNLKALHRVADARKQVPKRKGLFDVDVPFFLPLWRRVVVVAIAVCWGLFEMSSGATFWGMIFVGMGAIAGWRFYIADWASVEKDAKDAREE